MFASSTLGSLSEPLSGRHWTRQAVLQQVLARAAHLQARGLGRGERVFVHFGNTLEFFGDLLAVWSLGGCVVPIDQRLTPFEVETLGRAARPRLSLYKDEINEPIAGRLREVGTESALTLPAMPGQPAVAGRPTLSGSELALDADALILFTSGTTGQPKGVIHTHRSLRARWVTLRQSLGLEKYRRSLCLLPTHFGHGLICNCLFPWLWGQDLYILPPFRADILLGLGPLLDEHGITFMSSVPSVWRMALKTAPPPRRRTLERVSCGSAPLSAVLWNDIGAWSGAADVINAYGITETGSWVAGTTVPGLAPEDGLIGEPWGADVTILKTADPAAPPGLGDECRAGEEGYVWLNTPALMRGYLDRDDLTNQVVSQGWFLTGDIGVLDDRGVLYLRGREREEINKGGMKVHPADIDGVVERFDATTDVCTFAYEDPLYGQDVGIAVVLTQSDEETLRRLKQWTQRHVAQHKVPRRWYVLEAIPRTSRGKINRVEVARACAGLEPRVL